MNIILCSVVIICLTASFITANICSTVEKIHKEEIETWQKNMK